MSKKSYFIFIFLIAFCHQLFSQEESQNTFSLTELLQILESHSAYTFSYADEDLKNIEVPEPPNMLSVTETIAFLKEKTGFKFTLIGEHQIIVDAPIPVKQKPEKITVEELDEVILTNVIAKGVSKIKDGSFKINFDEIGIIPGLIENDAFQTIQALPGVESVNEKVSNINIRGGTNDQNLILWDGIRLYQSGHFFGLISAINPHQNHTVSLYKNGTPATYGNSVSSVIELSSAKKLNDDFEAEVGLTFLSADAFIDTPLDKKSSIQIAARTSINGAFITPTYLQYYDRAFQNTEIANTNQNAINTEEDFRFSDVSFRWLYQLSEKDLLRLNYFSIANELSFTAEEFNQNSMETKESTLSQNSLGMGAFYKRNWTENFSTQLQLFHSNYHLNSTNRILNTNTFFEQENNLAETAFKISSKWKLNEHFELNSGYEFSSTTSRDAEADEEITTLNKNFNLMIDRLKAQQDKLLLSERHEAWENVARKLAHEIKNPLTPIQLSIDRIREKYLNKIADKDENLSDYLNTITKQIKDIEFLVNEFSDFARMPKPVLKKVDINKIISRSVNLHKLSESDLSFVVSNDKSSNNINGDEEQLNRVFINLIKNSIEAIHEMKSKNVDFKGKISIDIKGDSDYIYVTIVDNGVGFKQVDKAKMITPYYTTKKKGTGLGLAIVTKVISDHNSTILFDSVKNGAKVEILFPKYYG